MERKPFFTGKLDISTSQTIRQLFFAKYPVFFPEAPYESLGRVRNVVFTCNAIVEEDKTVKIYYGAADTCIGLAEAKLDDLVASCYKEYRYFPGKSFQN